MAFNPIIGKDFTVFVDSSVMAFAESFEFSLDKKEIDVTNLSSAGWDEYVMGSKGWSASMDAILSRTTDTSRGFDYLLDNWLSPTDTSVAVQFKTSITGTRILTGSAWLTGLKASNSGVNSKATYSATFKGTGPIAKTIG
jgi:predicted secreted protein